MCIPPSLVDDSWSQTFFVTLDLAYWLSEPLVTFTPPLTQFVALALRDLRPATRAFISPTTDHRYKISQLTPTFLSPLAKSCPRPRRANVPHLKPTSFPLFVHTLVPLLSTTHRLTPGYNPCLPQPTTLLQVHISCLNSPELLTVGRISSILSLFFFLFLSAPTLRIVAVSRNFSLLTSNQSTWSGLAKSNI